MLQFDEATHVYRWKGAVVPSVTQALAQLIDFSMVQPDVLERARQLGTAVHRMIELECTGDLDEDSLTGPLPGYLQQWRKFVAVTGFKMRYCEHRLYSHRYGYAGTYDLSGNFSGLDALLDTKSGATPKTAGPQTAAYLQLAVENEILPPTTSRYVLSLQEEKWALSNPYRSPNDLRVYLSALTLHQFRSAA